MPDLNLANLHRQAKIALDRGDLLGATVICEEILGKRRNDVNARLLLADVAKRGWQYAKAIEHLSVVVKAQPRNAYLRTDLGLMFMHEAQLSRALAQFDKALKLEPKMTPALAAKASVYVMQNKHDRARRLLEPAVNGGETPPDVAARYMRILIRDRALDDAIALGRQVVTAQRQATMAVRETWFILAQALERSERFEEAFAAAAQGNAILAPAFDPDLYRRTVDTAIETFTPERLATIPRPAEPSEQPIFIVGIPRCGSTLTERIIHAHPEAHGVGEISTMFRLTAALPSRIGSSLSYPGCIADLDLEDAEREAAFYLDDVRGRVPPGTGRIVDKELSNFQHVGVLDIIFPRGRVIHCRRNAVDNCLACFMEPLAPANAIYATDLRNLGLFYRQYERLMRHWHDALDIPILDVDYEDLVTNQEAVTRRIIDFCGLPWDESCLRFHETKRTEATLSVDQVRKPVYSTSVGRADRFGALLDPLREALGEA